MMVNDIQWSHELLKRFSPFETFFLFQKNTTYMSPIRFHLSNTHTHTFRLMKLPGCISRSTQFAGNMLVFANQFLVFINHLAPIHQQKSYETKNGNKEHEGSPITLKVAYHQPFIIKKKPFQASSTVACPWFHVELNTCEKTVKKRGRTSLMGKKWCSQAMRRSEYLSIGWFPDGFEDFPLGIF